MSREKYYTLELRYPGGEVEEIRHYSAETPFGVGGKVPLGESGDWRVVGEESTGELNRTRLICEPWVH